MPIIEKGQKKKTKPRAIRREAKLSSIDDLAHFFPNHNMDIDELDDDISTMNNDYDGQDGEATLG